MAENRVHTLAVSFKAFVVNELAMPLTKSMV